MDLFMLFLHIYHNVISTEDSHMSTVTLEKAVSKYENIKYKLFLRTKSVYICIHTLPGIMHSLTQRHCENILLN